MKNERALNLLRSLFGIPLPADEAMMRLSADLKVVVASLTTERQRAEIAQKFPAAHFEGAFSATPAAEYAASGRGGPMRIVQ